MYQNKCTKCGAEFETKNPKRVICPSCLYPDRNPIPLNTYSQLVSPEDKPSGGENIVEEKNQDKSQAPGPYNQPENEYRPHPQDNGYNRGPQDGGYRPHQQGGGYNRGPQDGGYRPHQQGGGYNRGPQEGGFRPHQGGGFRRPPQQGGGFRRPFQGGGGGFRRPPQGSAVKKSLLISREQVAEIEKLYKLMLPLPNPDAHEVIGTQIDLEPHKVFFGINLVRQKMLLPKLPYPKRKLAVTPDQLTAIENLYSPLLPLPPIGCHKFIAKQLKMDEWRVHVGIGIVRKQMSLPRWNADREDAPEEYKKQREEELKAQAQSEKPEDTAPAE